MPPPIKKAAVQVRLPRKFLGMAGPWWGPLKKRKCLVCKGADLQKDTYCLYCDRYGDESHVSGHLGANVYDYLKIEVGEKYGRIEVLEIAHFHTARPKWHCRCECGTYEEMGPRAILKGACRWCQSGLKKFDEGTERKLMEHYDWASGKVQWIKKKYNYQTDAEEAAWFGFVEAVLTASDDPDFNFRNYALRKMRKRVATTYEKHTPDPFTNYENDARSESMGFEADGDELAVFSRITVEEGLEAEEVLDLLDEDERTVVVLKVYEEESLENIAQRLGIGFGTARRRYLSAVNKLQQLLADTA